MSCAICKASDSIKKSIVLNLRGNCLKSAIDTEYRVLNDERGYLKYIGKQRTVITYNSDERIWEMIVVNSPTIKATSQASISSMAIGKHKWLIRNDDACQKGNVTKMLSISNCKNDEFICSDGLCISDKRQCDGRKDCKGGEDEKGCFLIEPDTSYNQYLSPEPLENEARLKINLNINVLTIQEINEINSQFRVQYILVISWLDSRLVMRNLKEGVINDLKTHEQKNIWIPKLIFANTDEQLMTVLDEKASVIVNLNGSFSMADTSAIDYEKYFSGKENSLSMERFYNTIFECQFNMF